MCTDMTAAEMGAAWRLAYVGTRDRQAATAAVTEARVDTPAGDAAALLGATWSLVHAVISHPGVGGGPAHGGRRPPPGHSADPADVSASGSLDAAFWDLGYRQRGALWITEVEGLPLRSSVSVLGIGEAGILRLLEEARQGMVTIPPRPGCPPIARLGRYAVGDLDAVDAAAVDDHVVRCPTCRARCAQIEGTSDLAPALAVMVPGPPIDLGRPAAADGTGYDEQFAAFFGTGTAGDDAPTGQIAAVAGGRRGRVAWLSACSAGVFVAGIAGAVAVHPARLASQLHDPPPVTSLTPPPSSRTTITLPPTVLLVPSTTASSSTSTTSSSTTTPATNPVAPSTAAAPAPTAPLLIPATTLAPPAAPAPRPPTGTTSTTTGRPSPTTTTTGPTSTTSTTGPLLGTG
ncbi:MAG TPA: hypothetical protein VG184_01250 [Acidimicrobiales bacterium]|jgi:hypothetical protein|nr:hypothetical protein [Acidimicrobiales bacterium]